MPSLDRYLADGERIKRYERRHWAVLLWPGVVTGGVAAAAFLFGYVTTPDSGSHAIDWLVGLIALGFAAAFVWRWVRWCVDHVVVTDERIFEVSGIVTRQVASMPLAKLTDLTYRRTALGRLFGFGDLVVETPGQHQALTRIDYLRDPDDFYQELTTAVMEHIGRAPREEAREASDEETGDIEQTGEIPRVTPERPVA
jgi:hypothetical protein